MPFASRGEVRIYYEIEGRGPPLLLHTGAGGDLEIWREAGYPAGLEGFRLILMDQRGRGRSSRPGRVEDHSMFHYAEDVVAVLDEAGVESAGFWGYSNGMHVGLAVGSLHPQRLRALIGTGVMPASEFSELPPILDRERFIAEVVATGGVRADVDGYMREEGDRFPEAIDRNVRETDPRMGALRRIAWRDWNGPRSLLASFHIPVLLVTGEKEHRNGENAAALAALPDARMELLPSQGHLGAFYRSDLALPRVLPFLRDHLGPSTPPR